MKQKKTIASRVADVLITFASLFSIFILLFVIIKGMNYWSLVVKDVTDTNAKMFWIGLLIAIVYSCYNVIVGFVREIAAIIKSYK